MIPGVIYVIILSIPEDIIDRKYLTYDVDRIFGLTRQSFSYVDTFIIQGRITSNCDLQSPSITLLRHLDIEIGLNIIPWPLEKQLNLFLFRDVEMVSVKQEPTR